MECEICGSRNAIRKTEIDGAVLAVCNNCVSMGKEVARVEVIQFKRPSTKMPSEIEYSLKSGFGSIVRDNRQRKNLTQEQLGEKIVEKHSVIKRIEEGWEPPLATIKKLEKFFNIILTENSLGTNTQAKVKSEKLTLGDIAEIRKK